MARSRRGGLLLILAALAVVFGTAAMLLSGPVSLKVPSVVERVPRAREAGAGGAAAAPGRPAPAATARWGTELPVRVLRLPARAPAPGAEVLLQDAGGVWRAVADGDGDVVFRTDPGRWVLLRARAPGLVGIPRVVYVTTGAEPAEVVLAGSGALHGVVRSKSTGEPLEGARITVSPGPESRTFAAGAPEPEEEMRLPAVEATTGADGRFRIEGLAEGFGYRLVATKPGYADQTMFGLCPDGTGQGPDLEVLLAPGGRIVGTVRDPAGLPVEGAWVVADSAPRAFPDTPPWVRGALVIRGAGRPGEAPGMSAVSTPALRGTPLVLTAADGSYALEGLVRDRELFVHADREGWVTAGASAKVVLTAEAPEARCDLVLERMGEVLLDWTIADRPVPPHATVAVEALEGGAGAWSLTGFARGGCLPSLPPGRYRITVLAEEVGQGEEEAAVAGGGTTELTVPLALGEGIEGEVVDGDGAPVAGAMLGLRLPGDPPRDVPTAWRVIQADGMSRAVLHAGKAGADPGGLVLGAHTGTRSDGAGRFRFLGLRAGSRWRVRVLAAGFGPATTDELAVPASGVRIALTRSGAVSGRLVLPPGQPVARSVSFYYRAATDAVVPMVGGHMLSTAAFGDGTFRLGDVPAGVGTLGFRIDETGCCGAVAVDVPSGGSLDIGEFPLSEGVGLRGRVVDASGSPIAGASVSLSRLGRPENATTGPDGTFSFSGLPTAPLDVLVLRPAPPAPPGGTGALVVFADTSDRAVLRRTVTPTKDGPPIELRFPASGVLRGVARPHGPGGPDVPWDRVWAVPRGGGADEFAAYTDSAGRFAMRVPAGEYHVEILNVRNPQEVLSSGDASVPEGGDVTVDLKAGR